VVANKPPWLVWCAAVHLTPGTDSAAEPTATPSAPRRPGSRRATGRRGAAPAGPTTGTPTGSATDAGAAAPVFVDASGRRQRRVRRFGRFLVIPAAGYVALLLSAALGGPSVPAPYLPLPETGDHGGGVPGPAPSGASGAPRAPGDTRVTPGTPGPGSTPSATATPTAGSPAPALSPTAAPPVKATATATASHGRGTATRTAPTPTHTSRGHG
jgi:hypothetical protein